MISKDQRGILPLKVYAELGKFLKNNPLANLQIDLNTDNKSCKQWGHTVSLFLLVTDINLREWLVYSFVGSVHE
jgi:hypothetical protein